jgi:ABC-type transport system involved in multi-copper enzyme maturation permease subunit
MTVETPAVAQPTPRRRLLRRLVIDNPVMIKELRGRMRGARAFTVLTIYLVLLGSFSSLVYVAVSESSTNAGGQISVGQVGRTLFAGVVAIEMMLVAFIAPAFTSGAISGEREHQTFDLLRTTLLSPRSFILGKLSSAMFFVLLLLLAAIPLQSIAFFFGGVAETEIILSFLILTATALLFCTVGIFFSSRSYRTLSASVLTYSFATLLMFGMPLILGAVMLILNFSLDNVGSSGWQVALLYITGTVICLNPAATALYTQYLLVNQRTYTTFSYPLSNGEKIQLVSPWIPFLLLYAILTIMFFALAVRRVRKIEE